MRDRVERSGREVERKGEKRESRSGRGRGQKGVRCERSEESEREGAPGGGRGETAQPAAGAAALAEAEAAMAATGTAEVQPGSGTGTDRTPQTAPNIQHTDTDISQLQPISQHPGSKRGPRYVRVCDWQSSCLSTRYICSCSFRFDYPLSIPLGGIAPERPS
jgi:hypothetical protein